MRANTNESSSITVRVLKQDGAEHRRWQAKLSRRAGPLVVLDAEFDVDVSHELLGEIKQGTRTVEYYWLDRWYNVFRFLNAAGETRLWYCNINTPPRFADGELTYVDLDIDVLAQPDLSFQVLDEDEFEDNSSKYGYSAEVIEQAQKGLGELLSLIEQRQFPFVREASSLPAVVSL